jgi:hypothetical protein
MQKFETRFLTIDDVPALLELEQAKWEPDQRADGATLRQRIEKHPQLSIGSFCTRSGKAQASLFMCPVVPEIFSAPTRWIHSAAAQDQPQSLVLPDLNSTRSLFGISLSSISPTAVQEIFLLFYPHALKGGWRSVYLGSPIPGYAKARERSPDLSVWQYVHAKRSARSKEPLDPQLRYYYKKGFKQIVSIQENYFPHEQSQNYGVILRGVIPLSEPAALWKATPFFILESLSKTLMKV